MRRGERREPKHAGNRQDVRGGGGRTEQQHADRVGGRAGGRSTKRKEGTGASAAMRGGGFSLFGGTYVKPGYASAAVCAETRLRWLVLAGGQARMRNRIHLGST